MQLYTYNLKVTVRQGILMTIFKPHQFLPLISPYLPENPCIIEAGAFDGCDTQKIATFFPKATIHAFEPVPTIFKKLEERTRCFPQIHRYQLALSDRTGNSTFYVSEKPTHPGIPSQAGSLLQPKERLSHSAMQFPYTIDVATITIDEWAQRSAIDLIDMLWLDLQGHELSVLQAASTMLPRVRVIYTEVSFIESYAGQPQYHQVRAWIESQGFTLLGTDFQEPHSWFFGNALFVRTSFLTATL
jgi:FkbM family methyltransferase